MDTRGPKSADRGPVAWVVYRCDAPDEPLDLLFMPASSVERDALASHAHQCEVGQPPPGLYTARRAPLLDEARRIENVTAMGLQELGFDLPCRACGQVARRCTTYSICRRYTYCDRVCLENDTEEQRARKKAYQALARKEQWVAASRLCALLRELGSFTPPAGTLRRALEHLEHLERPPLAPLPITTETTKKGPKITRKPRWLFEGRLPAGGLMPVEGTREVAVRVPTDPAQYVVFGHDRVRLSRMRTIEGSRVTDVTPGPSTTLYGLSLDWNWPDALTNDAAALMEVTALRRDPSGLATRSDEDVRALLRAARLSLDNTAFLRRELARRGAT